MNYLNDMVRLGGQYMAGGAADGPSRCDSVVISLRNEPDIPCALPFGHDGMHRSTDGYRWTDTEQAES